MPDRRKSIRSGVFIAVSLGLLATLSVIAYFHYRKPRPIYVRGAVIKQDSDPMKESPITDVDIHISDGKAVASARSNFTGYFSVRMPAGAARNQILTLSFKHPDYQPLILTEPVGDKLSIIHMVPIQKPVNVQPNRPIISISNILIRYTTVTTTEENIGTEARTFQIPNVGNVPCGNAPPCSPDRKWKAAIASESLDAGEGAEFRNARVSCIAGPCPFTRIDYDGFSQGGRQIKVTVRNWSDTSTYLMQAEVFHLQINNIVRLAYPVILGTSLNFTLPPSADGPSIEAEVSGENIVFPLGPNPNLSWAECNVSVDRNHAKFFRCDLKSDYRFRESK